MSFIDNISKAFGISSEMDVNEFMTARQAEEVDVMHQKADFYVKPIALQNENDTKIVKEELQAKNLVLLNIAPLTKNPAKLKTAVDELKTHARNINGDIARIDEDKILLTPTNVKIVKKRK
ncbi:MAG: cell division protein SepF [Candidatus Marsarchaeota archaeon]|nr:cell division protein SepF [Candidatus Marsarchaeota archaeon]